MAAVSATLGFILSTDLVPDTLAVGAFLRAVLTSLVTDQFEVQQSVCVCVRDKDHSCGVIVTAFAFSLR